MQKKKLNTNTIIQAYSTAKKRILFLDFDGTLVPFKNFPELVTLDEQTSLLLRNAVSVPGNKIVIISGRTKSFLEKEFSEIGVSLVAEHGLHVKESGSHWITSEIVHNGWKVEMKRILERITGEFKGSMIEEKDASLVWHYRACAHKPDDNKMASIKKQLTLVLLRNNISFLEGKQVLEIKPNHYSKGTAALKMIYKHNYDFILAIGDDTTDEDLFRSLPHDAYTVKVGRGLTSARMVMDNQTEVLSLLLKMNAISSTSKAMT